MVGWRQRLLVSESGVRFPRLRWRTTASRTGPSWPESLSSSECKPAEAGAGTRSNEQTGQAGLRRRKLRWGSAGTNCCAGGEPRNVEQVNGELAALGSEVASGQCRFEPWAPQPRSHGSGNSNPPRPRLDKKVRGETPHPRFRPGRGPDLPGAALAASGLEVLLKDPIVNSTNMRDMVMKTGPAARSGAARATAHRVGAPSSGGLPLAG